MEAYSINLPTSKVTLLYQERANRYAHILEYFSDDTVVIIKHSSINNTYKLTILPPDNLTLREGGSKSIQSSFALFVTNKTEKFEDNILLLDEMGLPFKLCNISLWRVKPIKPAPKSQIPSSNKSTTKRYHCFEGDIAAIERIKKCCARHVDWYYQEFNDLEKLTQRIPLAICHLTPTAINETIEESRVYIAEVKLIILSLKKKVKGRGGNFPDQESKYLSTISCAANIIATQFGYYEFKNIKKIVTPEDLYQLAVSMAEWVEAIEKNLLKGKQDTLFDIRTTLLLRCMNGIFKISQQNATNKANATHQHAPKSETFYQEKTISYSLFKGSAAAINLIKQNCFKAVAIYQEYMKSIEVQLKDPSITFLLIPPETITYQGKEYDTEALVLKACSGNPRAAYATEANILKGLRLSNIIDESTSIEDIESPCDEKIQEIKNSVIKNRKYLRTKKQILPPKNAKLSSNDSLLLSEFISAFCILASTFDCTTVDFDKIKNIQDTQDILSFYISIRNLLIKINTDKCPKARFNTYVLARVIVQVGCIFELYPALEKAIDKALENLNQS